MNGWLSDVKKSVEYIKERFPEYVKEQIALADSASENTFVFTDRYEMERCTTPVKFEDKIDWNYVPFDDEEWNYAFNRHTFMLHLAHAYAFTGDKKYKESFVRLFNDFVENNRLDELSKRRCCRSLEVGIRVENYLRAIEIMRAYTSFDDRFENNLEGLLIVQRSILWSNHTAFHRLSNWGAIQDHGLFLLSLFIGDFSTMRKAIMRLDEEFELQTFSDGTHWEQSPMYQAEVLHAGLDTILIASRNGVHLPERFVENVHKLALGMMRISRPDGKCYLFGDSDEIDFRDQSAIASVLFSDKELSYYAGDRDYEFYWSFPVDTPTVEKEAPERFHFFPDSGNIVANLSEDVAIRFHAGPYGSGHGHFDQLHFDLYKNGKVLLTDTGRGTYVYSKWRRDLKGAFGHNTVIVDKRDFSIMTDSWGIEHFAEPMMAPPIFLDDYTLMEAMHFGYFDLGVIVKRRILTIEDRFVVLFDNILMNTQKPHYVDFLFHFDPSLDPILEENRCKADGIEIIMDPKVKPSLSKYAYSRRYNEKDESSLLTLSDGLIRSTCFVTVISLDSKPVTVHYLDTIKLLSGTVVPDANASSLRIQCGSDSFDILNINNEYPSGGFLLKCGEIETYARVAVKKNDQKTVIVKR